MSNIDDAVKIAKTTFSLMRWLFAKPVVEGKVIKSDGKPAEGITVHVGETCNTTAHSGKFIIDAPSSGLHKIALEFQGQRVDNVEQVRIGRGSELTVNIQLSDDLERTLQIQGHPIAQYSPGDSSSPQDAPEEKPETKGDESGPTHKSTDEEEPHAQNPKIYLKDWIHKHLEAYKQTHGEWPSDITCRVFMAIEKNTKVLAVYRDIPNKDGAINRMIGGWIADYTGYNRGQRGNLCSSGLVGTYTALLPPRSIKVSGTKTDETNEPDSSYLRKEFQRFQADPTKNMQVEIRRYRAAQIRHLLSEPEQIDAVTFDKEVWNSEKDTFVNNVSFPKITYPDLDLSAEQIEEFEAALLAGTINFAGNPAWNPGSNKYAPSLKDEEQRDQNIQEVIVILNDQHRAPFQKVLDLQGVYGVGRGVSTGLVMLYHPHQIMICNRQTITALQTIIEQGWFRFPGKTKKEEDFQKAMEQLKEDMKAEDFLELDWFLYLVNVEQYCTERKAVEPNSSVDSATAPRKRT